MLVHMGGLKWFVIFLIFLGLVFIPVSAEKDDAYLMKLYVNSNEEIALALNDFTKSWLNEDPKQINLTSKALFIAAGRPLDVITLLKVSPDYVPLKTEFQDGLKHLKKSAEFGSKYVEYYNKGDTDMTAFLKEDLLDELNAAKVNFKMCSDMNKDL